MKLALLLLAGSGVWWVADAQAREPPLPPAASAPGPLEEHLAALREFLPAGEFHLVVSRPFVVIGDGERRAVERSAERTVGWAVTLLKESFFDAEPAGYLDVWLFQDEESYERHTRAFFGRRPHTPFGFYSPEHRALIMNIATGGGTLVHELVHPFVRADFPACPAWLNEGLGSLFEQCGVDDEGRIVGRTNWRLGGLQKAIRAGEVPPFARLLSTGDAKFYDQDPGTNYAQARYLCYYLQERGLLRRFYREFRAAQASDPTWLLTLRRVLGTDDLELFQLEWSKFVLELRFP
ncbi:MAG TPA: hypothetical protein PK668_25665 [Myxococcota bacterium]|nr:hypothetical protein [Myxococcota bacterium]HRY96916.1 hypothetical protein [Myxococcota bacterium]HSA22037.1 hypothetical protein [Myxococcota bacterium]